MYRKLKILTYYLHPFKIIKCLTQNKSMWMEYMIITAQSWKQNENIVPKILTLHTGSVPLQGRQ